MKKNIFAFVLMLVCAGCSSSGGGGGSGSETNPTPTHHAGDGCAVDIPTGANNLSVAKAFNEYRIRCNPNEAELEAQLQKLQ